jgi:hypothetical protein
MMPAVRVWANCVARSPYASNHLRCSSIHLDEDRWENHKKLANQCCNGELNFVRCFSNHIELADDIHQIFCALFQGTATRVDNSFCLSIEALPASQDRA